MSGSDGELEVSEILGERKSSRRGLEYLVRWKDFGPSHDTWEPFKNLSNAAKAIAAFHANAMTQKKKSSRKSTSRSRSRSRSRGRSGSRSPSRGKKRASPGRKSSSTQKSSTKTVTTTTTTSTPTREETKTETVSRSPGRLERTTETLTRSVITPSATQRSLQVTRTSEVRATSTSNETPKPAQSKGCSWLQVCCTPLQKMKDCCTGLVASDYPAIVVFATITVILLSFVLERNVDFEKMWGAIVTFFTNIWVWLKQLVSK